jgi:hypothetical protein
MNRTELQRKAHDYPEVLHAFGVELGEVELHGSVGTDARAPGENE